MLLYLLLLFTCSLTNVDTQMYMEWITRYKFFPLASAAYSNNPILCLENVSPKSKLIRRYEVPCDPENDTCSGYLAVSPVDQAIILVFRGTNSEQQLTYEETEIPKGAVSDWPAGGKVAQYYYNAFMSLWNGGMAKDFANVTQEYALYQLWITGHSLGGSMATLGASYIAYNNLFPRNKMFLTTFGEPRVGDCDWAASVNSELTYSYRIVHANDMFALAGANGTFCQHKTEVWYPQNMTISSPYWICEVECNPNPSDYSFEDHIM